MASRVLGAFAVTATAALATLAMATPASAHTNVLTANCDEKTQTTTLTVDLTRYSDKKDNTVEVSIGGRPLPQKSGQSTKIPFRSTYKETGWATDGKVSQKYHVSIKAYDDPNSTNGWSKEIDVPPTKVCGYTPPKPDQPKPQQPPVPQPPVVTTTEAPSSSVTPPAPGGSTPEPPLAATGASPGWLLLSGLGLVGAGAGTLMFLRRRRSA